MILDKTSIEEILYTDGEKFQKAVDQKKNGIFIRTDTEQNYFDKAQIGNDSIDLRIADYGFVMLSEYNYINTLSEEDFAKYYKQIPLPEVGFILNPGELIFVPTYERIALSGNLIGRITGRSVFARMGLSVHCTQDKFSSGINSVAGLQIINNSPIPLKIFPKQKLAQLLVEWTGPNRHPYKGSFCEERNYKLPIVRDADRSQYDDLTKQLIKNQIPKKLTIWKKKRSNFTLSVCELASTTIATIAMGSFGILDNITGLVVSGIAELIMLACFKAIEFNWWKEENEEHEK